MESWDDENFEPKVVAPAPILSTNKWEGEDEEDEVKESWEDEEEEEQQQQQQQKQQEDVQDAPLKTKKKNLQEKIAEKERLKHEEHERRLKAEQQEEEMSLEEQMRRQKESDITFALETTFVGSNSSSTAAIGIDSMNPNTKEEFQEFSDAISSKLQPLTKNVEYPNFAEDLIRNICVSLSSLDLKKIKTTIENLYQEKQKMEKGDKARKNKGKGKAKLKMDNENQYSAYVDDYDEFDDFM